MKTLIIRGLYPTVCVLALSSPLAIAASLSVSKAGSGNGTVTASPGSINCGSVCVDDNYASGTTVYLSAISDANSSFGYWSGDCTNLGSSGSAASAQVFLDTQTKTCTANFDSMSLTVNKLGTGTGTISSYDGKINCGTTCSGNYGSGAMVTLIAQSDVNSQFTGWSGSCSGTSTAATLTMGTTALSCSANFNSLASNSLTVNKTGTGTGTISSGDGKINCGTTCSGNYGSGTMVILTAQPGVNSQFTGWSGSCSGTSTAATLTISTAALSCSANFNALVSNSLIVNKFGTGTIISGDGKINCGTTCSGNYGSGTMVMLIAQPDVNSQFTGWSGACSGTSTAATLTMGITTLSCSANFNSLVSNSLTVNKLGTGTGTVNSNDGKIKCGTTCSGNYSSGTMVTLQALPDLNSQFTGWTGACTGTSTAATLTMSAAGLNCTANFNALVSNSLIVNKFGTGTGTISSSDGKIKCGTTCSGNYGSGTMVILIAQPDVNSQFTGWSGACTGTSTAATLTMNTAGLSCTANFNSLISNSLTVDKLGTGTGTISSSDGKIDCGTTCSGNYSSGTMVTLQALPGFNSQFTGWSGACTGTSTAATLAINATSLNCTANFELDLVPLLTVIKTGSGQGTVTSNDQLINCGQTCSGDYASVTMVILTAQADANSHFTGWGQACSGTNTTVSLLTTPTSDLTCAANFEMVGGNSTLFVNTVGSGSVISEDGLIGCGDNCSGNYASGNMVTLMAQPDSGFSFGGWSGDCTGNATAFALVIGSVDHNCTAEFVATSAQQQLVIAKEGQGTVNSADGLIQCGTTCTGNYASAAMVTLNAIPDSGFRFTGWSGNCQIGNNSSATVTLLMGDADKTCTAHFQATAATACQNLQVSNYPQLLDFGTVGLNDSQYMEESIYLWGEGCGDVRIQEIQVQGPDQAEFVPLPPICYYGHWENHYYGSCQIKVQLTPHAEGPKTANLYFALMGTDLTVNPIPMTANVLANGQAALTLSPVAHDFGEVTAGGFNYYHYQPFSVQNVGNVNAQFRDITVTGPSANEFNGYEWSWCNYVKVLKPGERCEVGLHFLPITAGPKQAELTFTSNANPISAVLTGTGIEPTRCEDANITLESTGNSTGGHWATAATWQRLQNSDQPSIPNANDVVRIKAGHVVTGVSYSTAKTLCIEEGGVLEGPDQHHWLSLQVTDYLENKGTIRGKSGQNETATTCTGNYWWDVIGKAGCAQSGADIYISAGLMQNEGEIVAGAGGSGRHYAGYGGGVSIYGTGITNIGLVRAGQGGHLTGTQATAQAGFGGYVSMWAQNYLHSDSARGIYAGNGGDCNFTAGQVGGNGGNLRLNAQVTVNLAGPFITGKGGRNCDQPPRDGGFNTDPGTLTLGGKHTKIEAGEVNIYGGQGWTLRLQDLEPGAIVASEGITLAAGKDGVIDLRDNAPAFLQAQGPLTVLADQVLTDEGTTLSELASASEIVRGPNTILRQLTLQAPSQLVGAPAAKLSIPLTLSNASPEPDTYQLQVTNSQGWELSGLPATVELAALDAIELPVTVTLPTASGAANVLTFTATSQADPTATTSTVVRLEVVGETGGTSGTGTSSGTGDTSGTGGSSGTGTSTVPGGQPATGSGTFPSFAWPVTNCPSTGLIEQACYNQRLKDAVIAANVSGGSLAGRIENRGFISQVTVEPDAVVTGGLFSGYILNNGMMSDFTFVGASLTGGILGGQIVNASKVGGVLIDVQLAAGAHITGGKLQGRIQGDESAPALLENVRILAGSHLSGVKLGQGVQREEPVIVEGEIVDPVDPKFTLPELGLGQAHTDQGQELTTDSSFAGGMSVGQDFETSGTMQAQMQSVKIAGEIQVDTQDVGKMADLIVYFDYQAETGEVFPLMLDEQGGIFPRPAGFGELLPFKTGVTLSTLESLPIYEGILLATGELSIHFGYRLQEENKVVHSLQPVHIVVK